MSTQQDIYAAGSESHPLMLNKENYVSWSSRLLQYAKSRPNGKLIHNSILNDDELSDKELKQIEANDQAIQTILLGLPEDIYAAIDSQDRQMQMVGGNGRNQFRQYTGQNSGNPAGYNDVIGNQLLIAQKEEARIQLQSEEYDLMAAVADLDEIEEVNANCILMA
nr:ribonuclease H-like domain-containing protein [Tanacetum cinerariifolium]